MAFQMASRMPLWVAFWKLFRVLFWMPFRAAFWRLFRTAFWVPFWVPFWMPSTEKGQQERRPLSDDRIRSLHSVP